MGNKPTPPETKSKTDQKENKIRLAKEKSPPLLDAAEELDKKWKEFCSTTIAKYHRNRAKFIFLGALSKSYRVKRIDNRQYGFWYKDEQDNMIPKCDSVYADFSIDFSLSYNSMQIDLKLSAIFNNKKYALFDDNFATKDWTIKLIVLNRDLKALWLHFFSKLPVSSFQFDQDSASDVISIIYEFLFYTKTTFIDDIYLYKNGEINELNCGLLDALLGVNVENDCLHMADYVDILLQWFLSQDATNYRKKYVETEMIWQN